MRTEVLIMMLLMAAVTYIPRVVPAFVIDRLKLGKRMKKSETVHGDDRADSSRSTKRGRGSAFDRDRGRQYSCIDSVF